MYYHGFGRLIEEDGSSYIGWWNIGGKELYHNHLFMKPDNTPEIRDIKPFNSKMTQEFDEVYCLTTSK